MTNTHARTHTQSRKKSKKAASNTSDFFKRVCFLVCIFKQRVCLELVANPKYLPLIKWSNTTKIYYIFIKKQSKCDQICSTYRLSHKRKCYAWKLAEIVTFNVIVQTNRMNEKANSISGGILFQTNLISWQYEEFIFYEVAPKPTPKPICH